MLTLSFDPYERGNETQKAQISLRELVESREDVSIVLDPVNEALHKVALSVKVFIVLSQGLST